MRVTTSDQHPVVLDHFEELKKVANKIRKSPVNTRKGDNRIIYNGNDIDIQVKRGNALGIIRGALEPHIPNVLGDMKLCSRNGEVYLRGSNLFQEEFVGYLNFLLVWLTSFGSSNANTSLVASQVRDVIEWIKLVMDRHRSQYSEGDFVCVEDAINGL
jgi:hypothetical protein